MRRFYSFLIVLFTIWSVIAAAHAHSPASATWQTLLPGLEYRAIPLGQNNYPALHQLRFNLENFCCLPYKASEISAQKTGPLSVFRNNTGALAALNGGYFDTENNPIGYLQRGGRELNAHLAQGNIFTGVFCINEGNPTVWAIDNFLPRPCEMAIQAGPRLIVEGRPTSGVHGAPARLSGIACDYQNRVIFYHCDPGGTLTLSEMQKRLLGPVPQGGLSPKYALNLDGGTSAGLSLKVNHFRLERPAFDMLPSAIIIKKR